jgi:uncharacterized protein YbaA (DUF1428 family)
MAYVDGFLLPVPKKNLDAYRRMSRKAGKVWREHGALDYKERDRVNRKVMNDPRTRWTPSRCRSTSGECSTAGSRFSSTSCNTFFI